MVDIPYTVSLLGQKVNFTQKVGFPEASHHDNGLGYNSVLVQLIQMPSVPCMIVEWSTLAGGKVVSPPTSVRTNLTSNQTGMRMWQFKQLALGWGLSLPYVLFVKKK